MRAAHLFERGARLRPLFGARVVLREVAKRLGARLAGPGREGTQSLDRLGRAARVEGGGAAAQKCLRRARLGEAREGVGVGS